MSLAVLVGSCEKPDRLERRSEGPVGISNAQPVQLELPGLAGPVGICARARGRYLPRVAKKTKPILDTRDQLLRFLASPSQRPPILEPPAPPGANESWGLRGQRTHTKIPLKRSTTKYKHR